MELRTRHQAPLGSLAFASGNAKKRRVQIRALLNPWEVEEIQEANREAKKRKHVWGDNGSQIANDTIGRIGASIDAEAMLAACDE
jgi:hypothetical protein